MWSINDPFDECGYAIYSNLEALLLKFAHKNHFSHEMKESISLYKDYLNPSELTKQLEVFGASIKLTNIPSTINELSSILRASPPTSIFFLNRYP